MKTPKNVAVMLGALSFIRVDGLRICGYVLGGRVCKPMDDFLTSKWGITQGFTILITDQKEIWIRWNQDLPDITDLKINICGPLFASIDCFRHDSIDNLNFLRSCEQFNTRQLLSRMNNPEWEPGD